MNKNSNRLLVLGALASLAIAFLATSASAYPTARPATLTVVKTISAPGGKALVPGRVNTVRVHPNLAFKVLIRGGVAPQHLKIGVGITRGSTSLSESSKAVAVAAHQSVFVTFSKVGPMPFAQRTTMKVDVHDARTREQWTLRYPIIFTLP